MVQAEIAAEAAELRRSARSGGSGKANGFPGVVARGPREGRMRRPEEACPAFQGASSSAPAGTDASAAFEIRPPFVRADLAVGESANPADDHPGERRDRAAARGDRLEVDAAHRRGEIIRLEHPFRRRFHAARLQVEFPGQGLHGRDRTGVHSLRREASPRRAGSGNGRSSAAAAEASALPAPPARPRRLRPGRSEAAGEERQVAAEGARSQIGGSPFQVAAASGGPQKEGGGLELEERKR